VLLKLWFAMGVKREAITIAELRLEWRAGKEKQV